MRLTNSEQEIMEVFWEAQEPLSRAELLTRAGEDRSWKDRSAYILLNGLMDKGALKEDGFVSEGKAVSRRFSPSVSYEQYMAQRIRSRCLKPDIPRLLDLLLESYQPDTETIEQLKQIVKDRQNA